MAGLRALVAIGLALAAGLALGFIDSRPGYDATGITAVGLAIAAFAAVIVDGSGRPLRVAMLAVLAGIWIPIIEVAPPGTYGPFAALVFAAAGAIVGMLLLRGVRPGPADTGPSDGTGGG